MPPRRNSDAGTSGRRSSLTDTRPGKRSKGSKAEPSPQQQKLAVLNQALDVAEGASVSSRDLLRRVAQQILAPTPEDKPPCQNEAEMLLEALAEVTTTLEKQESEAAEQETAASEVLTQRNEELEDLRAARDQRKAELAVAKAEVTASCRIVHEIGERLKPKRDAHKAQVKHLEEKRERQKNFSVIVETLLPTALDGSRALLKEEFQLIHDVIAEPAKLPIEESLAVVARHALTKTAKERTLLEQKALEQLLLELRTLLEALALEPEEADFEAKSQELQKEEDAVREVTTDQHAAAARRFWGAELSLREAEAAVVVKAAAARIATEAVNRSKMRHRQKRRLLESFREQSDSTFKALLTPPRTKAEEEAATVDAEMRPADEPGQAEAAACEDSEPPAKEAAAPLPKAEIDSAAAAQVTPAALPDAEADQAATADAEMQAADEPVQASEAVNAAALPDAEADQEPRLDEGGSENLPLLPEVHMAAEVSQLTA